MTRGEPAPARDARSCDAGELARDGAAAPLFDVIQAQDPGLQFSGDGHKHAPWSVGWIEGRPATSHEVDPHEQWQPAAAATAS